MKAFTIWQPWASLIVLGLKPVEYRKWVAPRHIVGQRLVIHAGTAKAHNAVRHLLAHDRAIIGSCGPQADIPTVRAFLERCASNPTLMPLGVGLGTAELGQPARADVYYNRLGLKIGEDGPWNIAWPMLDVQAWDEPVPCRGAQGFWNWPLPIDGHP